MKHYAGLDLSMESTQVCIVDDNGRKVVSEKVESSPEAIAMMLERYGPIERAVIETGRMSPAICLGLRELGAPVVCIDARQCKCCFTIPQKCWRKIPQRVCGDQPLR
jgi:transposase